MLKDRLQEIFEFTKSESPYRKANKGWINQDIFLDLSPSVDTLKQKKEAAKVTLFWSPINNLLSNIFLIIIISSMLVFTSLSLSKGRFGFDSFNTSLISNIVKVEDNKVAEDSTVIALDSVTSENEESLAINQLDKINNINPLDENPTNSGDEPLLIARRTNCPVVVDPDRVSAVEYLISSSDIDIVISDDGLQHYQMYRDLEICMVDGDRLFGNSFCFPAGPLREPIDRIETVDFVVMNGSASNTLNSSAVRSNSICLDEVSVASASTWAWISRSLFVNFSICNAS